ncbi:hypothetical protein K440DRAFT_642728 [Wilcoxina mikolae CBS 423.85]|nr:hypothetical protein K440DRAFT_642728 [Wilcoxina mikolae CBS 423.85]
MSLLAIIFPEKISSGPATSSTLAKKRIPEHVQKSIPITIKKIIPVHDNKDNDGQKISSQITRTKKGMYRKVVQQYTMALDELDLGELEAMQVTKTSPKQAPMKKHKRKEKVELSDTKHLIT